MTTTDLNRGDPMTGDPRSEFPADLLASLIVIRGCLVPSNRSMMEMYDDMRRAYEVAGEALEQFTRAHANV